MSNEKEKKAPERSASDRLKDLEGGTANLYNIADNMARDLSMLKGAAKLLDNKLSAVISLLAAGSPVTNEAIDSEMIKANVIDLANKVTNMVVNGIIAAEEAVSENSFIVGSESDETGKVVNPRIQFALKALSPELQSKLLGVKPGEEVQFQEGKGKFKLLESYKIVPVAEEAAPVAEAAPEAPALEATPAQPEAEAK